MINQIMDLTKISAGRYDLRKDPRRCRQPAVAGAREPLRTAPEAKQITIDAEDCPRGADDRCR